MHWPFLPFLLQFAMGNYTQNWIKHETDCCKNRTFYSSFLYPKERKEMAEMAKRNRTNPVQFYLSDDEQYILNTKFKASGMKSIRAIWLMLLPIADNSCISFCLSSWMVVSTFPPSNAIVRIYADAANPIAIAFSSMCLRSRSYTRMLIVVLGACLLFGLPIHIPPLV